MQNPRLLKGLIPVIMAFMAAFPSLSAAYTPALGPNSVIRVPQPGGLITLILGDLPAGAEAVWYADDQTTVLYASAGNFFQTYITQPATFYGQVSDPLTGDMSDLLEVDACLFDLYSTPVPFSPSPIGGAPGIRFAYTFGTNSLVEAGRMIVALPDSTYVMAGDAINNCGDADLYLIKSNCAGEIIWQHAYGGQGNERIQWGMERSLIQTPDGGFMVLGTTNSFGQGLLDLFLVKTDAGGNQQWAMTYGGNRNDYSRGIAPASDGGYIIANYTTSDFPPINAIDGDIHLIKIDAAGNVQWHKLYPKPGWQDPYVAIELPNGSGYLTTGTYGLTRVDNAGNEIWALPGVSGIGYILEPTADGGVMYAGRKFTGADGFMWKLDGNGDPVWPAEAAIPGPGENYVYVVKERDNGNWICAGEHLGMGAGDWDFWFFETDANANVLWERTFGGTGAEWPTSMKKTADGDYIAIGLTTSYSATYDFLVVKLDIIPDLPPVLDPASVTGVSPGQNATLIIQALPPGYAAVWYDSDGVTELYADAANLFQPVISSPQTFYGAIREIATGCESEKIEVLTCVLAVQASYTAPPCAGKGNLYLFESGGGAVSWTWTGPGGFVSTEQNPVIVNPGNTNTGPYTVVVTGPGGCSNSQTILVEWALNVDCGSFPWEGN